ncbi:MAG TPA: Gfo/Idh/MocA family oxidoreductase [Tepidisphaeraceae bacterium]|nr:Gfo/Idh/MocA family oxidoreductase [Tepidisphaeraceae bacterium]
MQIISRREALSMAAGAGMAAALSSITPRVLGAEVAPAVAPGKKVRIGIIGTGDRGTALLHVALNFPEVEFPVLCDINQKNLERAQNIVERVSGKRPEGYDKGPYDYRRMLARDDFDAVIIATPQELHAEMAVDAMNAKKFVGSEVPAAVSVEECWNLVKAQQKTGTGYTMLENYCYFQPVMMVQNMVDKGVFGDLTYAYGTYIHEIRWMRFKKDGTLTWRGDNVLHTRGIVYPTHGMGPVCHWLGINRGDKLESLICMDSKSAGNQAYAAKKFGPDSPQAKIHWENGDVNKCLIHTKQGRLIEICYDTASARPSGIGTYALQGTTASYGSDMGMEKIYIEGRTHPERWDPIENYKSEYQSADWAELGAEANRTGHGGADYFVIKDFIKAIRTGKSPVDVVDAATWTVIRPLSEVSCRAGGKPIEIPDFSKA